MMTAFFLFPLLLWATALVKDTDAHPGVSNAASIPVFLSILDTAPKSRKFSEFAPHTNDDDDDDDEEEEEEEEEDEDKTTPMLSPFEELSAVGGVLSQKSLIESLAEFSLDDPAAESQAFAIALLSLGVPEEAEIAHSLSDTLAAADISRECQAFTKALRLSGTDPHSISFIDDSELLSFLRPIADLSSFTVDYASALATLASRSGPSAAPAASSSPSQPEGAVSTRAEPIAVSAAVNPSRTRDGERGSKKVTSFQRVSTAERPVPPAPEISGKFLRSFVSSLTSALDSENRFGRKERARITGPTRVYAGYHSSRARYPKYNTHGQDFRSPRNTRRRPRICKKRLRRRHRGFFSA